MDEENNQNAGLPIKPLFPVFNYHIHTNQESSNQINHSHSIQRSETLSKDNLNQSDNDLESLQLDLKPSTLNAIIAAQKLDKAESQQIELSNYNRDNSSPEVVKGKQISSSDFEDGEPVKRKKKRKDKKKKKKYKKDKYDLEAEDTQQKSEPSIKVPAGAVFLEDIPGLEPQHAFHVDRKCNNDLWHYKCVSKMHIAKFRCHSYTCLGAPDVPYRSAKVDRKTKHKPTSWRYWEKKSYRKSLTKGLNVSSTGEHLKLSDSVESYIPLPKEPFPNKMPDVIGNYSCLDTATSQYAQGIGTDYSKPCEENIEMSEIFEKVRSYNQKTRESPHNVQLWLEFIQFQDVVAQEDKSFQGHVVRLRDIYRPSKSVIEKKLAILEKAIDFNPSSLELKLARLELYQDIWEADQCDKAWQDLLFTYAADIDLWRQYLSNQQSRLVKFTFGKILKLYHKCFQTVVPILEGQVKVINKPDNMEDKLLGLFCQYCDFLNHTGYTERAISSFQALIEFNLFCPISLNLTTTKQRVEIFQTFWESGVTRFGEPKAKGWSNWFQNKQTGSIHIPQTVNTDELEDKVILEKLTRSLTWLKMEKIRQEAHMLPWKPNTAQGETEDDCEDLDRMVLFDDIKPALFKMTRSESCLRLICMFLKFLGLSCDTLDRAILNLDIEFNCTKFDQYSLTGLAQCFMLAGLKPDVNVDSKWQPSDQCVVFMRDILLQAEAYFSSTHRNLFTLLRLELEVVKFGTTRVTELTTSGMKDLKRFGKNLLKDIHNRSNLVLWNAYIRLLWACSDNIAETVSMVDTAMGLFTGSTPLSDVAKASGLCMLCKTYCEIILNFEPLEHISMTSKNSAPSQEDKHQVIACLGALVENKPFKSNSHPAITSAYVLKLRRRFEALLRELSTQIDLKSYTTDCDLFVTFAECFALFEFSASNYKSANQIFSLAIKYVKEKQMRSSLVQHLYCRQIAFITNIMGILILPISIMRQVLDQALSEYPQCPYFHAVFLHIESGAHIAGRLRKFYDRSLRKSTTIVIPMFYLMSEFLRHQAIMKSLFGTEDYQTNIQDSGSINRIRALFEHCVQLPGSSHCPLLWRLYLTFEAKFGNGTRAKGIFYRSLQSCPWAKCIYLDGVSLFGDENLQETMDLMTEEEIRVRIPLEEVDLLFNAEKGEEMEEVEEEELNQSEGVTMQEEMKTHGDETS
ncbi:protein NRDE2 [Biomphalaria glabrata]|nr:putative protein NRDE2 [Biomphalaria glabrata]